MPIHETVVELKRVALGDRETRSLESTSFTMGVIPENGLIVNILSGGVSHSCYITDNDIKKALDLKPGSIMKAKGWDPE